MGKVDNNDDNDGNPYNLESDIIIVPCCVSLQIKKGRPQRRQCSVFMLEFLLYFFFLLKCHAYYNLVTRGRKKGRPQRRQCVQDVCAAEVVRLFIFFLLVFCIFIHNRLTMSRLRVTNVRILRPFRFLQLFLETIKKISRIRMTVLSHSWWKCLVRVSLGSYKLLMELRHPQPLRKAQEMRV